MQLEFEAGNDKKYEVDSIRDSAIYAKESTTGQLPGLYYLVLWKSYPKEENTWELALVIQHLQRLITAYHKNNPKKPTVTSLFLDTAPPMARPIAALTKNVANLLALLPPPPTSGQRSPRPLSCSYPSRFSS